MHIIRTILWFLLVAALLVFAIANWEPVVTVRIWPGLVLDTKIPVLVITSFLLGFLPVWLYLRAAKWQWRRKNQHLDAALRASTAAPPAPAAVEPAPSAAAAPAMPVATGWPGPATATATPLDSDGTAETSKP